MLPPVIRSVASAPAASALAVGVVGATTLDLAPSQSAAITFAVGLSGLPVRGERVELTIENATARGAMLGADTQITDDDGMVTVRVSAGQANGSFDVAAKIEDADPVRVHVTVSGAQTGNVVARVGYHGAARIDHVAVRLHDGRAACSAYRDPSALPTTLTALRVPNTRTAARFNGLLAGSDYVVSATAIDANGRVVATGCGAAKVVVQARRDVVANVEIEDVATRAARSDRK
jgi:hypothetical protein